LRETTDTLTLEAGMQKITVAILLAVTAAALAAPAGAQSNQEGLGAGILLGEPSGLSLKLWTSPYTAWAGGFGYSLRKESDFHGHLDYLWHKVRPLGPEVSRTPLFYGIGARWRANDEGDDTLGIRIPWGLEHLFANSNFDVFVELVPIIDVLPELDFGVNVGAGARYFF
jgi:hypothetical protein